MSKPLKAYSIMEEDEGTGGIVFASCNAAARRIGSSEFGDGDFNWGKALREPWADQYAPGPVPRKAMLDRGWWFPCAADNCRNRVCIDAGGDPVERNGAFYCSSQCAGTA